eukprot:364500-Chlamydomonas_euryale.AAC.36
MMLYAAARLHACVPRSPMLMLMRGAVLALCIAHPCSCVCAALCWPCASLPHARADARAPVLAVWLIRPCKCAPVCEPRAAGVHTHARPCASHGPRSPMRMLVRAPVLAVCLDPSCSCLCVPLC